MYIEKALKELELGNIEQALELLTKYINENPDDSEGYIQFGHVLMLVGDGQRAKDFYLKAFQLDSQSVAAIEGLGSVLYEEGSFEAALKMFEKANVLQPNHSDTLYMLGMSLVQMEKYSFALPYLQRATELSPEDAESCFQYGLLLAKMELYEEAKKAFNAVVQLDEEHADAWYNLGIATIATEQDAEQALNYLNKTITLQPEHQLALAAKEVVEAQLDNK